MIRAYFRKQYIHIAAVLLVFSVLIFAALYISFANAQKIDVEYPIAELGNCVDEEDCKNYCDKPENISSCIDFGESRGLMSAKEAEKARKLSAIDIIDGPGGCTNEKECEEYCENPDNIRECILFAKENDIMSSDEIEEAEKVIAALDAGVSLPGGCANKSDCEAYCEDESHIEECVAFAEAAGFMSPEEAEIVRKTGGKGPGGCKGKKECDEYCENPDNLRECILFGKEHDLLPPDEIKDIEGMLRALDAGVSPPACKSKKECDMYCSDPANSEECLAFAIAAGFIDEENAENAREMFEKGIMEGPGGCKGKEECDAYCENPDNMDECINFSSRDEMMRRDEFGRNEKMMRGGPGGCKNEKECMEYCEDPENREECIREAQESGMMSPDEFDRMKDEMDRMMEGRDMNDFHDREEGDFREHFEIDEVPDEFKNFIREDGKPLYEGIPEGSFEEGGKYEFENGYIDGGHNDGNYEGKNYEDSGYLDGSGRDFLPQDMYMDQGFGGDKNRMDEFGDYKNMMPPEDMPEEYRDMMPTEEFYGDPYGIPPAEEFYEKKGESEPSSTQEEPTSMRPKNMLGLILAPIMELLK